MGRGLCDIKHTLEKYQAIHHKTARTSQGSAASAHPRSRPRSRLVGWMRRSCLMPRISRIIQMWMGLMLPPKLPLRTRCKAICRQSCAAPICPCAPCTGRSETYSPARWRREAGVAAPVASGIRDQISWLFPRGALTRRAKQGVDQRVSSAAEFAQLMGFATL